MSDLYIESRLQAIKDIASASCSDIKDADNIASFCDEIYSAIPNLDKIVDELEERKALHERLVDYETKNGTVTEKYQHIKAIDVLNEAIEIVKQGGESESEQKLKEMESE